MAERHAVYANTSEGVTFRIGRPVSWDAAVARWYRLDDTRREGIPHRVRHERRWYSVESFEVRAVDRHGVGLGSERHARAIHIPYIALLRASGKGRQLSLTLAA